MVFHYAFETVWQKAVSHKKSLLDLIQEGIFFYATSAVIVRLLHNSVIFELT